MEVKTIAGCIAGLALLSACSSPAEEDAPAPEALVTVAAVVRQQVGETVRLFGVADTGPGGKASLVAPIEARLIAIDAPVGSPVGPGQPVLRLAPGPTAALDMAKARSDAQTANAAYARALRMRADGLASNAEVETARAGQASANATVRSLTGRSLVLRAPFAGHVEAISAAPGDIIAAGTTLASISGNGAVRIRFGLDPVLGRRVNAGAPMTVSRAGDSGKLPSTVVSVDPVVDPQTRLASLYVRLPASSSIRAGEALTGTITMSGSSDAIVIPYGALLDDAGQPYVYVVVRGLAHRRDILTGVSDGNQVAVLRGLAVGEQVVVDGGTALEDGMKVRLK